MARRRRLTDGEIQEVRDEAAALIGEPVILFPSIKGIPESRKVRRAAQMASLYDDHHWPMERVGQAFGMSRERVRQIFNEYDIAMRTRIVLTPDKRAQRKGAFVRKAREKLDRASEDSQDVDVKALTTLPVDTAA